MYSNNDPATGEQGVGTSPALRAAPRSPGVRSASGRLRLFGAPKEIYHNSHYWHCCVLRGAHPPVSGLRCGFRRRAGLRSKANVWRGLARRTRCHLQLWMLCPPPAEGAFTSPAQRNGYDRPLSSTWPLLILPPPQTVAPCRDSTHSPETKFLASSASLKDPRTPGYCTRKQVFLKASCDRCVRA